jgi:two-component system, chemotaxis family, protein-glutamate methylesterase/glutaminase
MAAIRVLVVDDSVVVRRLVGDVVSAEPGLALAGVAADGLIALSKIPQVNPDVVVLDVEMPKLGGLETLVEIRKVYPRLPVIMFSSLTERGATTTLDALTRGASDYVTKPSGASGMANALAHVKAELVAKIFALCGSRGSDAAGAPPRAIAASPARPVTSARRGPSPASVQESPLGGAPIDVVAIGASTGGPNALTDVLCALPADFPVPIVVTQHMPPMFTRLLAERIDARSALTVREAAPGALLVPGSVFIAPGDHHMVLGRDGRDVWVVLNQEPPENGCRPAVDVMLRSAASVYGRGVLSVILTGMGQDGMRGSEVVRERGGSVFAQDEETSVVWGMPGFVARHGVANRVVALPEMAMAIQTVVAASRRKASTLERRGSTNAG